MSGRAAVASIVAGDAPGSHVVVAIVAVALAGALPAPAAAGRPDPPTWSDEFAGSALDPTRWAHRASGVRHQGIFTPEAVDVAAGRAPR